MTQPVSLHIPRADRLPRSTAYLATGLLLLIIWVGLYVAYRLIRAALS